MKIEFDCDCGKTVTESTRNSSAHVDVRVPCRECGSIYAVTITRLG